MTHGEWMFIKDHCACTMMSDDSSCSYMAVIFNVYIYKLCMSERTLVRYSSVFRVSVNVTVSSMSHAV